jgi:hypothetical protein
MLHNVYVWRFCRRANFLMSPVRLRIFSKTCHFTRNPPESPPSKWFTLLGGRLIKKCAVAMTLSTWYEAAYR